MPAGSISRVSPAVMMNGKVIQYYSRSDSNDLYRNTFSYSASGVSSNTTTYIQAGTSIPYLPSFTSTNGITSAYYNQCWSHSTGSGSALFKYANIVPFRVTWDGNTDSSFTSAAVSSGGTYSNGGTYTSIALSATSDAALLANGNLVTFGVSDGGNTVALVEFTPALAVVRATNLGSMTGLAGSAINATLRKTTYGYVAAITHSNEGNGARCFVVTLGPDCATIIGTRSVRIQNQDLVSTVLITGTVSGSDGVIFGSLGNSSNMGAIVVPTSATGVIATVTATQYHDPQGAMSNSNPNVLRTLMGSAPVFMGCTKYADGIAPTLFASSGSQVGNRGVAFQAKSVTNDTNMFLSYVDMQLDPIINANPSYWSSTVWMSEISRTVSGMWGQWEYTGVGHNLCFDESGFIYISSIYSQATSKLLQKVNRAS